MHTSHMSDGVTFFADKLLAGGYQQEITFLVAFLNYIPAFGMMTITFLKDNVTRYSLSCT